MRKTELSNIIYNKPEIYSLESRPGVEEYILVAKATFNIYLVTVLKNGVINIKTYSPNNDFVSIEDGSVVDYSKEYSIIKTNSKKQATLPEWIKSILFKNSY